jgi:hypothetical protein
MNEHRQSRGTTLVRGFWHFLVASMIAVAIFVRLGNRRDNTPRGIIDENAGSSSQRTKLQITVTFIARYLLSILIGIASLFFAYKSLYVNPLAPDVSPAVALVTWPQSSNSDLRPDVSVEVSASPGYRTCGQVHVHVVFTPDSGFFDTGSAWAAYRRGGPPPVTHFAIGIEDLTPPENVKVRLDTSNSSITFSRPGIPLRRPYGVARAQHAIRVGPLEASYGSQVNEYALPGTITDWPVHRMPVIADFNADWTAYRSIGSCYVQLPSLVGHTAAIASSWASIVIENHAHVESVDPNNPTPFAQALINVTDGISTLDPRSPAPDSPAGYSWTCTPTMLGSGPDCNGLVIATLPSADNIRSFATFISAALFSLALQMAYEQRRRHGAKRRP